MQAGVNSEGRLQSAYVRRRTVAAAPAAEQSVALQATHSARSPAPTLLEAGVRPARALPARAAACAAGPGRKQAVQGLSSAAACMTGARCSPCGPTALLRLHLRAPAAGGGRRPATVSTPLLLLAIPQQHAHTAGSAR